MTFVLKNTRLLSAVKDGSMMGVKAALEAGADVDGHPEEPYPPIVAATMADDVIMVEFLLQRGAHPDMPVSQTVACPGSDMADTIPGERALHIAARSGKVEIVGLLLQRARANPNATDARGGTPLLAACSSSPVYVCVEVVSLLLMAGANPTLPEENGFLPLHGVALKGHIDLVDMLYSRAPATLNHRTVKGNTPLFVACSEGHESVASKLLSLGAMQPTPLNTHRCPLTIAALNGSVEVVRILVNEGGIRAVGGEKMLAKALFIAISHHHARILRLLLTVDGGQRRSELANNRSFDGFLIHDGAAYVNPAAVSILLEAGADDVARDSRGCIPLDIVGMSTDRIYGARMNGGKEVAIRRMLQRGPAYRARSWAWPVGEVADAVGIGDGASSAAAGAGAAGAAAAVLPSPAVTPPLVIGVRIFRRKEKSSSKFFVRLIGR